MKGIEKRKKMFFKNANICFLFDGAINQDDRTKFIVYKTTSK